MGVRLWNWFIQQSTCQYLHSKLKEEIFCKMCNLTLLFLLTLLWCPIKVRAFHRNESYLSCLHPPLSYEGRGEQKGSSHFDEKLSFWWDTTVPRFPWRKLVSAHKWLFKEIKKQWEVPHQQHPALYLKWHHHNNKWCETTTIRILIVVENCLSSVLVETSFICWDI